MDPHNPTKRERAARARQRQQASSSTVRRRHTQQPSGGGVSARKRDEGRAARQRADAESAETSSAVSGAALRDRLHSGATATMSAVGERLRRAAQIGQDARRGRDPLARPTTWIVEPSWYERIHNWLADVIPFSWRERARRHGYWRRKALPIVAILACLSVGLIVGVFALNTVGHAASVLAANSAPAQATTGGSVMISPLNSVNTTPTPALPQYDIGVWVSDTLPQGGSVTVFARVSNNSQAQPGAKVSFSAVTPRGVVKIGPFTTDAYGVASGKLNYGNVGAQQPIYLTGATTIDGQTYTGEYTFVTFG